VSGLIAGYGDSVIVAESRAYSIVNILDGGLRKISSVAVEPGALDLVTSHGVVSDTSFVELRMVSHGSQAAFLVERSLESGRALRSFLRPPPIVDEVGHPTDPVSTRACFRQSSEGGLVVVANSWSGQVVLLEWNHENPEVRWNVDLTPPWYQLADHSLDPSHKRPPVGRARVACADQFVAIVYQDTHQTRESLLSAPEVNIEGARIVILTYEGDVVLWEDIEEPDARSPGALRLMDGAGEYFLFSTPSGVAVPKVFRFKVQSM
jgi:hypothetical protein